jgi:hypothetical protein
MADELDAAGARARYHAVVGEIVVAVNDIETMLWLTIAQYLQVDVHRWDVFLRVIAPSLNLDAKRRIVHEIAKERVSEDANLLSENGPVAKAIATRNRYAHSQLANVVNPGGEPVGAFGLAISDHRRGKGGRHDILEDLADVESDLAHVRDALSLARTWAADHASQVRKPVRPPAPHRWGES